MELNNITRDLRNHSIEFVLKKYDLTWQELIRIQDEKHGIDCDEPLTKYINFNKETGKHMIVKDKVYYGSYNSISEARTVLEELILCNWNRNSIPVIIRKHGICITLEFLK